MKIAIYTIAKNEENYVERWAQSNTEADIRLICDTGSNDSTIDKLKNLNVNVIPITVSPWRFDFARNTVLNLLPSDIDVCIWQDLDETLLPGWREELENKWEQDTTVAYHKYRHNNGSWQWHNKIHARHNCHWLGHVHETLKWAIPEKYIWLENFYLDEHQDHSKNRSSYLDLLLKKIKEGDRNWRTFYFLANDYQKADMNKSIEYRIESYNSIKDDSLIRSYISNNIARQFLDIGDKVSGEKWFNISLTHSLEKENTFYYSKFLFELERWDECYIMSKRCIEVTEKRTGFTYDAFAWSYQIYDFAAISCYKLGMLKIAEKYGLKALEMQPNDYRLQQNLKFYQDTI